jgi:hypothetical protein
LFLSRWVASHGRDNELRHGWKKASLVASWKEFCFGTVPKK